MGDLGRSERDIEQAIVALKKGAHLLKYGRRGKPRFCPFRLSADEKSLIWFSGNEEKQLKLSSVTAIIPGQRTSIFQRQPRPEKEYQSFSLIYRNGDRTLDLICKDKEQAEIWFVGLRTLVSEAKSHLILPYQSHNSGFSSTISSPSCFVRRNQSIFPVDSERIPQASPRSEALSLRIPSHGRLQERDQTEQDKHVHRSSVENVIYSSVVEPGSAMLKGSIRESNCEEFRTSLSSAISLSSHGSGHGEIQILGDVLMWGEGVEGGILGGGNHKSGSSVPTQMDAFLPKTVQSTVMLDVNAVACGARHAAIVTRQGEMFCWGEENGGRLGHRVDADVSQPKLVEALANVGIESVSCGEFHTCALTKSGELYTWGDGTKSPGLLGHGKSRSQWFPRKVAGLLDGFQILKVSCGEWHTAVITSLGQLFTFGEGTFGALGHGDTKSAFQPKLVQSLKNLKTLAVACGPWHTAAVVDSMLEQSYKNSCSGKLYTWGDGDKGRLGHGDKERRLLPKCVVELSNCDFVQVGCGQSLTVALTVSGQVFTMGSSSHGQLGNPQGDGKATVLVQDSLHREFVEEISVGSYHVAVLTSKGKVYTWGRGANGRLGHGDIEDRNVPTFVEALNDRQVQCVSCGSAFTAVICLHKPISGEDQSSCTACKQSFGFTRKRHNCYNCGFAFCRLCSSKKALKASLAPNRSKPYRVCDRCFLQLTTPEFGLSSSGSNSRKDMFMQQMGNAIERTEKRDTKPIRGNLFSPKVSSLTEQTEGVFAWKQGKKSQSLNAERWGQVHCSELFLSGVRENSSALTLRSVPVAKSFSGAHSPYRMEALPPLPRQSPLNNFIEESMTSKQNLEEELNFLREKVKELQSQCERKDAALCQYENDVQKVWSLVGEENSQCNAAKDVIKLLTAQLKEVTERVPWKLQTDGRVGQAHLNALKGLMTPINTSSINDADAEDFKYNGLSHDSIPSARLHLDRKIDNTCNLSLSSSRPMSSPPHQESPRDMGDDQQASINNGVNHESEDKFETGSMLYTEWVEQDEPGVYITFTAVEGGCKDLKRVRFSRKRFSEKEAEKWWTENRFRVYQKYNIGGIETTVTGIPL